MSLFAHLLPLNEADRVRALAAADTTAALAEPVFQSLVALLAQVYQGPSIFISVVGSEQVDFPAVHQVPDLRRLPREQALCSLAVSQQRTVVLNELLSAPKTAHQRTAQRFGIAAYVGAPVWLAPELPVGVLCLSHPVPREFSEAEVEMLEEVAELVSHLLVTRQHLLLHAHAPQWQATQQLVTAGWQSLQELLTHLAERHGAMTPTSPAILQRLRQQMAAAEQVLSKARAA